LGASGLGRDQAAIDDDFGGRRVGGFARGQIDGRIRNFARLAKAFPDGVTVERVGLAEAIAKTAAFLNPELPPA
jgi:hypothetical protein